MTTHLPNDSPPMDLLAAWARLPTEVSLATAGLSDDEMAAMPGSDGLSLKELVHHLTEANVIAAGMIIAALGASGASYDWSWLYPNREWTDRMSYQSVPTAASLSALESLIGHISNVITSIGADALAREVRLFDKTGADPYTLTVGQIIRQEIDHADQHLADVRRRH